MKWYRIPVEHGTLNGTRCPSKCVEVPAPGNTQKQDRADSQRKNTATAGTSGNSVVKWRHFVRQPVWKHSGRTALSIGEQMSFILLVAWTWQLQRRGVWKFVHKTQISASNCGFLSRPPVLYTSVLWNCLSRIYLTFSQHCFRNPIRLVYWKVIGGAKRKWILFLIQDEIFCFCTELRYDFIACYWTVQKDNTALSLIKFKILKLQRNFGDL